MSAPECDGILIGCEDVPGNPEPHAPTLCDLVVETPHPLGPRWRRRTYCCPECGAELQEKMVRVREVMA